jgi:hypothetical protein
MSRLARCALPAVALLLVVVLDASNDTPCVRTRNRSVDTEHAHCVSRTSARRPDELTPDVAMSATARDNAGADVRCVPTNSR